MESQRTSFERHIDDVCSHNDRLEESNMRTTDSLTTEISKDLGRFVDKAPVSFTVGWDSNDGEEKRKQKLADIEKGIYSNKQRLVKKDGKFVWEYI